MMNGSTVAALEAGDTAAAPTFRLAPRDSPLSVPAQRETKLCEWLSSFADVGFVDLNCWPKVRGEHGQIPKTCGYTAPFFFCQPNLDLLCWHSDG